MSSTMRRTASSSWPAGSFDLPVLVALAGEDRAGLAAAHGDHHISGLNEGRVELGGGVVSHRQAALGEHLGDNRVTPESGSEPAERTSTVSPA
jgi:hypothetical protein